MAPFLYAVGAFIAAYWEVFYYVGTIALTAAYGDYKRKQLNKQMRDAWNASLRDRTVTINATDAPKTFAYGESVVGGVLWYGGSFGADGRDLYLGILVGAGHEIQAISDIALNNEWLTLDVNGLPDDNSAYFKRPQHDGSGTFTATGGVQTVTVTSMTGTDPILSSVVCFHYQTNPEDFAWELICTVTGANTFSVDSTNKTGSYNYTFVYTTANPLVTVERHLGSSTESGSMLLTSYTGGEVTSSEKGIDAPYIALKLVFTDDAFPNGIPQIMMRVQGKRLYDPRKDTTNGGSGTHRFATPSTWEYSDNSALCAADYLTSPLGRGATFDEVDWDLVRAAAAICDDVLHNVPLWNPTTKTWGTGDQKRYTCNGILTTDSDIGDNIDILAMSMAGLICFAQGKWRMYPGAYRSPGTSLTSANVTAATEFTVQARNDTSGLFNCVKGQFVDPNQNYQMVDYPPIVGTAYITEDNGERIFFDLPLPLTDDGAKCQRIGLIVLEQERQSLTIKGSFDMAAYKLWPGETFQLTMSEFGWTNKVFRVVEREFALSRGGPTLIAREEDAAVYTGTTPATYDISPNTSLPTPETVVALTGLTLSDPELFLNLDGKTSYRVKVEWNKATDIFVLAGGHIDFAYQTSRAPTEWVSLPPLPGDSTFAYIENTLLRTGYQARIRAVNGAGIRSPWTYSAVHSTGDPATPAAPTDLDMLTVGPTLRRFLITMSPVPFDSYNFIFGFIAGATMTWASAEKVLIAGARPSYGASSVVWSWETALPDDDGAWSFEVRSINSSGVESSTGAQLLNQTLGLSGTPPTGTVLGSITSFADAVAITWDNTTGSPMYSAADKRFSLTITPVTGLGLIYDGAFGLHCPTSSSVAWLMVRYRILDENDSLIAYQVEQRLIPKGGRVYAQLAPHAMRLNVGSASNRTFKLYLEVYAYDSGDAAVNGIGDSYMVISHSIKEIKV